MSRSSLYRRNDEFLVSGWISEMKPIIALRQDGSSYEIVSDATAFWLSSDSIVYDMFIVDLKGKDRKKFYERYYEHYGLHCFDMLESSSRSLLSSSKTYSVNHTPIITDNYLIAPVCSEPLSRDSTFITWVTDRILIVDLDTGWECTIDYHTEMNKPILISAEDDWLLFYMNGRSYLINLRELSMSNCSCG